LADHIVFTRQELQEKKEALDIGVKQWSNRSLKRIGVKQAASLNFLADCQFILAEIEILFRLKKGIVMAENERGGKVNWKRMGVTE
jgi:hypothetical protein